MRAEDLVEGVACALHWILMGLALIFVTVAAILSGAAACAFILLLFATCGC